MKILREFAASVRWVVRAAFFDEAPADRFTARVLVLSGIGTLLAGLILLVTIARAVTR